MNRIVSALNLILAFFMVAMVIAYVSIIIPIALACGIGFFLILWLYAHLVDGAFTLGHRIKRLFVKSA